MTTPKLFQPIQVGDINLGHRVVLAPLTRFRADDQHVPSPLAKLYYSQRATVPGTLLIGEAAYVAAKAGGMPNVPGIWSTEQIAAWKEITDAVHEKGSHMFLQLWALGRAAQPEQLQKEDPSFSFVSSSDVPMPGTEAAPRPLTIPEIQEYIQLFATAASNAVHKAGFDGVEIHATHGYLIDQFLQDTCNKRQDSYGGSVGGRARLALEVVDAVVKTIGESKTAIRMGPWCTFQGMRMNDPIPTYSYLVAKLRELHPNMAYLHAVEPRVDGDKTLDKPRESTDSNDFIRHIWHGRLITAGGYTRELALQVAEEKGDIIAFGRSFISNPDLPYRLREDIALTPSDRQYYYCFGSLDPEGYTSYEFAPDFSYGAEDQCKLEFL